MQTQIKNRIHALLHRHGIRFEASNLFGVAGRRFLDQLVAPEDVTLREGSRKVLRNYLETLDHVRGQIAQATQWFRHLSRPGTGQPDRPMVRALVVERRPGARPLCTWAARTGRGIVPPRLAG